MAVELEESNIALLGSDLEIEARKKAAETEEAYKGAGEKCGILVWRIESFKVVAWPKEKYGSFYDGDSFICLHTYTEGESEALLHDIYFWIGAESSQDEYGTAAYMTVVLDDLLGTTPVQHREVQGHETDGFITLWNDKMRVMKGGVDSGFNHVEPDKYEDRLLHVKGTRNLIKVTQVDNSTASMNHGDVFIFDHGAMIYQWNGQSSNVHEKTKGNEVVDAIIEERGGRAESQIVDGLEESELWDIIRGVPGEIHPARDENLPFCSKCYLNIDTTNEFCRLCGNTLEYPQNSEGGDREEKAGKVENKLFRVSDASGDLEVTECDFSRSSLDTDDVFIIDGGSSISVWIGKGATRNEQRKGMKYAVDYLITNGRPLHTPVVRMVEGRETSSFNNLFK